MALEAGPERRVRTPGAKESEESRDVANVRVTKGRVGEGWVSGGGGRCGESDAAAEAEKVSSSDMMNWVFVLGLIRWEVVWEL